MVCWYNVYKIGFGAEILLQHSKIAKPPAAVVRGSSKEFSHHGAQ
jgi:hypothetical protein